MSGPFKLKGWSPFTKKSALKDKGDAEHQKAHGTNHSHPPGTSFAEQQKVVEKRKNPEAIIDQEIKIEGAQTDLENKKINKGQYNKIVSGAKNKIVSLKKKP